MKFRFFLIFLFLTSVWSLMIFQAFRLQLLPQGRIDEWKKSQFQKKLVLSPRRGSIYDRHGRELAVTVRSYSLFGNPQKIENLKLLSLQLAKILSLPSYKIRHLLKNKNRRFKLIHRHLNKKQKQEVEALKNKALFLKEDFLRVYPNASLLSQVLGFVGREGLGLEGLELEYNEFLKGEKRNLFLKKDAHGRPLFSQGQFSLEPPEGYHLYLTIDRELQFVLQETLIQSLDEYEADSAIGLILNSKTGEVLAMSNVPNFDLNRPLDFPLSQRKNRAVTDLFEPGSILKSFTIAAALRENILTPQTKFYGEKGKLKVGGQYINEAREGGFEWLSVTEILSFSSNVGSAKVAFELGALKLRKALKDFGFGQKTEVDLPGEARGVLHSLPWKPHLLSNISFGHGLSATPLQVASSYLVFANKGRLMKPYVVKSIRHPQTKERFDFKPQIIRQVLHPAHVNKMKQMLLAATAPSSTGYRARPFGLEVAGKTSTAQKFHQEEGGYPKGLYVSSFIGMIPVEDPQFIIYVILDHPRKKYYASQVAAPVFAKVAGYTIRKETSSSVSLFRFEKKQEKAGHIFKVPRSQSFFSFFKRKPRLSERTTFASSSSPSSSKNQELSGSSKETLNFKNRKLSKFSKEKSNSSDLPRPSPFMPDLKGLALKEVYQKMASQDVKLNVLGQGRVVKTKPLRGQSLSQIKTIHIWLEKPKAVKNHRRKESKIQRSP